MSIKVLPHVMIHHDEPPLTDSTVDERGKRVSHLLTYVSSRCVLAVGLTMLISSYIPTTFQLHFHVYVIFICDEGSWSIIYRQDVTLHFIYEPLLLLEMDETNVPLTSYTARNTSSSSILYDFGDCCGTIEYFPFKSEKQICRHQT